MLVTRRGGSAARRVCWSGVERRCVELGRERSLDGDGNGNVVDRGGDGTASELLCGD